MPNNRPHFVFSSNPFRNINTRNTRNANINTRNANTQESVVKMSHRVVTQGALKITNIGIRNATTVSRQCLTEEEEYGDEVDYDRGLEGLEEVDEGALKRPNFLQRCWKAVVNSPASFLVPLSEMLEPLTSLKNTPELVKCSAKMILLFAKLYLGQNKREPENVLLDQLVGLDATRHELKMIVSCILGCGGSNESTPTGVLLHGPLGTGKTTLANALAWEAKVSFLPINGVDLVQDEKGIARLNSIFAEARVGAPSIVFISCVESVKAVTHLVEEIERCNMDGIVVIVVATTEKLEKLAPDLRRQLPRVYCLEKPDLNARKQMADVLLKTMKVAEEEKETISNLIASETSGLVWSDLKLLCKEARILAKYGGGIGALVTKEHVSQSLKVIKANKGLPEALKEANKAKKEAKKEAKKKAKKDAEKGKEDSENDPTGKAEAVEIEKAS